MLSLNEAGTATEVEKNFYLSKTGTKGVVKDITLKGFIIEKATRHQQKRHHHHQGRQKQGGGHIGRYGG